MYREPHTVADLMTEAAKALIKRDPQRLEQLEQISAGWLQAGHEQDAQRAILQAMCEAADLLLDSPSEIHFDEDESE